MQESRWKPLAIDAEGSTYLEIVASKTPFLTRVRSEVIWPECAARREHKAQLQVSTVMAVNQVSRPDSYPLPRVDELFATLAGGKTFSKLDLQHAYLQLPLETNSKQYTTINTHRGLFQYNSTTDYRLVCHLHQRYSREQLMTWSRESLM